MRISRSQVAAICSDPSLWEVVGTGLGDSALQLADRERLAGREWDELADACIDALVNEAQDVESFEAEQSKGVYRVAIRGVPGAYFVSAAEFDNEGVFDSLSAARAAAELNHGEFRV